MSRVIVIVVDILIHLLTLGLATAGRAGENIAAAAIITPKDFPLSRHCLRTNAPYNHVLCLATISQGHRTDEIPRATDVLYCITSVKSIKYYPSLRRDKDNVDISKGFKHLKCDHGEDGNDQLRTGVWHFT